MFEPVVNGVYFGSLTVTGGWWEDDDALSSSKWAGGAHIGANATGRHH